MCQGVVATCCDYKVFTVLSSNFLKIFIIFFGSLELGIELAHCGRGGVLLFFRKTQNQYNIKYVLSLRHLLIASISP